MSERPFFICLKSLFARMRHNSHNVRYFTLTIIILKSEEVSYETNEMRQV